MDIFKFNNYKAFLTATIRSHPRGFQSGLAKGIGCQGSYLIQVLTKKSDLTEDQALSAAEFLNMSEEERDFFLLLVGQSRAISKELRTFYSEKISKLKNKREDIKNRMPSAGEIKSSIATEYFSNWDVSTIHILTSSPLFQDPKKISDRLGLNINRVNVVLKFLETNNLVERQGIRWIFKGDPVYLPKDSPLNYIHQINRRDQVARSIREFDPEDIHFASGFMISKKQFDELRNEIKLLIEVAHKKIVASPSEEFYSLVIDLFKVV